MTDWKLHARTLADGLGVLFVTIAVLAAVIVVFAGLPSLLWGEPGALFGSVVFALLGFGYLIGLFKENP